MRVHDGARVWQYDTMQDMKEQKVVLQSDVHDQYSVLDHQVIHEWVKHYTKH